MPCLGGRGTRLRSSNSIAHFANLTPIKKKKISKGFFEGLIGVFRIGSLVLSLVGSVIFPEFAPAFIAVDALIQEAFDIKNFVESKQTGRDKLSFGLSTLVNVIPLSGLVRGARTSKNVLRIVDTTAENGFRYVVRGVDSEFSTALAKLGSNRSVSGVSRITLNKERTLIQKGIINAKKGVMTVDNFEMALQKEFSSIQSGERELAQAGRQRYYSYEGDYIFTNKDLAKIRHEIRLYSQGKRTEKQVVNNLRTMSTTAKEAIGYEKVGRRWFITSMGREKAFLNKIDKLSNIYTQSISPVARVEEKRFMGKFFNWKGYKWFGTKKGRRFTQIAQLANPNDMARELLNKPTGFLINGYSKGKFNWKGLKAFSRKLSNKLEKKIPKIMKVVKSPIKTKIYAKYEMIKKTLSEHGALTQDDEFLMGWRVLKKGKTYSEVIFHFNPINTNAKTPGSLNFGGKKAFTRSLRNDHLKYLQTCANPGSVYLKGGGGFPPVALSPGGRRPVHYQINEEAFELLTLVLPIGPLRNILSVVSNFKNVVTDISKGTYRAKWLSTFTGTFKRLWTNKVTRILGQTVGNLISKEAGAHLSRLLKNVGQGFQRTKSTTKYVNGKKIIVRSTSFSFGNSFNWKPLIKQGIPQTFRSTTLRRTPNVNPARVNQKYRRYGTNLRRLGSIPF